MSGFIHRVPWTVQPQVATQANPVWNPSGLWNFATQYDAVSGRKNSLGSGGVASQSPGQFGLGTKVSGTASFDRCVLNSTPDAINIGAGNFTVIVTFRLDGTGGYSALSRWNSGGSAGTNTWLLGAGNSFGVATFDFSVEVGSTVYNASGAGSWTAGETYTLVGQRSGTSVIVYRYAHTTRVWLSATVTNAGITTVNDIAARKLKIGEIDASAALNAGLTPFVAATFKRSLLESERAAWVQNPWQLFAPLPRRIWAPAAAGSGTTYTIIPSGGITLAGTSVDIKGKIFLPSGGVSFAGTGGATFASGGTTYTISPTGGLTFGGTATQVRSKTITPSGGLTLSGTGLGLRTKVFSAAGGVSLSGTGSMTSNTTVGSTQTGERTKVGVGT